MSRPTRDRKAVDRMTPTEAPVKEAASVTIPEGSGEVLGEIVAVEKALKAASEEELKPLHSILFGRPGKDGHRRRTIKKFHGFAKDDPNNESRLEKLAQSKHTKDMCKQLALHVSGTKVEMAERINDFLLDPSSDSVTEKKAAGKKRKASDSGDKPAKKSKAAAKEGPTRPNSGYIMFSKAKRADVVKKNPDLQNKEIMSKIAELWNKASQSEKDKFTKKGQDEFEASGGPARAAAAKKKKDAEKEAAKAAKKSGKTEKPEKAAKKPAAKKAKKAKKGEEEAEKEEEEEEEEGAEAKAEADEEEGGEDAEEAGEGDEKAEENGNDEEEEKEEAAEEAEEE
ncbi:hypothetical protein JKP88DRAFT_263938 [Tribonema minus]|uniref:HMG box domain-containing protein n=1 Tax=Tribonema minus TaxID=303371 RepID=A0A835YSA1_9STRA|nr:hypothetical protein JKP88DRAFT_263938 [Tribonema minus]